MWIVIVVLVNLLGSIAYLLIGRKNDGDRHPGFEKVLWHSACPGWLSLTVQRGLCSVFGPNGAGKTTTIAC